jgi:hypothetical protein
MKHEDFSAFNDQVENEKENRFSTAQKDESSLGNILITLGYVTPEQVKNAIEIQKMQAPIGEILVRMKAITREQLEEALMLQKVNRGEATIREEGQLYRTQKKRLLGEVVDCLQETTSMTQEFVTVNGSKIKMPVG